VEWGERIGNKEQGTRKKEKGRSRRKEYRGKILKREQEKKHWLPAVSHTHGCCVGDACLCVCSVSHNLTRDEMHCEKNVNLG